MVAYSLGDFAFCSLTLLTKNGYILAGVTFLVLVLGSYLPLLEIEETPDFMLYSKGHHEYMALIEKYRKKNHAVEDEKERKEIDHLVIEREVLLETFGEGKEKPKMTPLYLFQILRKHFFKILSLSFFIGFINVVWMTIIFNLENLGFDEISYNGLAFAAISSLASMAFIPMAGWLSSRSWALLLQSMQLVTILLLHLLYQLGDPKAAYFKPTDGFLVLGMALSLDSMMQVPFYQQVAEMFPVELRGLATSIIQCSGCLIQVLTPWLCALSKHWETHYMVGCSLVGVVSLVLTFFLKETLP